MIVFIDFPEPELRRIQAYAAVSGIQPSQVVRRACRLFLDQEVGSDEYERALEARRAGKRDRDDTDS